MYYEINVSLNGKHFFATAERSLGNIETMKKVLAQFKENYPEADGYKISLTLWETIGHEMNVDEVLNSP